MDMKIIFKEETKNAIKFYRVDEYLLDMKATKVRYDFQNLFNGEKYLADNIMKVVNENSIEVFQDVKPGIEKAYALFLEALARRVFDKIPAEEIFPK